MAAMKRIAGLIVGIASVTAIGVAVAQGVPPNPFVKDPPLGAGQQNLHLAPMGETGTPWGSDRVEIAQPAQVFQPAPVAQVEERQVVVQAPVQQEMGAAPAPAPAPVQEAAPAPMNLPRQDRG